MSSTGLSELVSRDLMVRSLARATGREDVQLVGEPRVERATEGVEGFTSLILRVRVAYRLPEDADTTLSKFFVVKRNPQIETQLELVKSTNVFDREGAYFDKVVPIMRNVSGGKVDVPLPNCFVAVYGGDDEAIIMEDLGKEGFRTPDPEYRAKGLDLPHCSLAMKTLGRLHALAVAAERSLPASDEGWLKVIPEIAKDLLFYVAEPDEQPMPFMGMINNGLDTLVKVSKKIEGLPMEAAASGILDEAIRRTWPTLCRLVKPDPRGRNVLNHGDCWMNNVMFRYEKNNSGDEMPMDAKFIDFQTSRYCHPSVDLLYFMYLSTTRCFRNQHFDRLIVEYFESMEGALKALDAGTPPLSLDELLVDLHDVYKPFGIIIGILFTPILRLGNDFIPDTADEMTPEKFKELFETGNADVVRKRFANDPEYRSVMEELVGEYMDMAFPDGLGSLDSSRLWI